MKKRETPLDRALRASEQAWEDWKRRAGEKLDASSALTGPTQEDLDALEPEAPPTRLELERRRRTAEQMQRNWPEGKRRKWRQWWRR